MASGGCCSTPARRSASGASIWSCSATGTGSGGVLPGFDLGRLSDLVGARLDGLVGADVLSQVPFTLDWRSREVTFHETAPEVSGEVVPVTDLLGVPVVEFDVAGYRARGFLDTGAVVSFLGSDAVPLPHPFDHRHEFHPGLTGFEEFDTPLWRLPVRLGRDFVAVFGRPPRALRVGLELAGVPWILGADLWKAFPVLFDLPAGRVVVL
jgi:hypothetical protein